ncbi:DUF3300 domain-containing protein [Pseudomonas sp. R-28-1W-6]|uniref:DUF3300 domain-containing protein n=1 Tax=Pseudomonas sp. R-28-1W-6 TaxID=2650101 RepID=UPI0013659C58|nr:DUF3300 domain-containing protein [Pseudomonas sp. R-28-1W-6]MWV13031.1 DUF3300 domain-containing protein [Pseudomonas sp. R-28-1W-6]
MRVCHRSTILLAVLVLSGCPDEEPAKAQAPAAEAPVTVAAAVPPSVAPAPAAVSNAVFTPEELDQMMAPLALYPDALLAQVLMASTYPGDVADAVVWSKAHPDSSGDSAVREVADQPWDPSVQSLVAFPAALATLGQDPAWVQRVGDAFLAQPDAVMDSVQRLRRQAKAAGNLESNEQQRVTEQPAAPAPASAESTVIVQQPAAAPTIIIEPAQPQTVYVPSYNPNQVYGTWAYPSSPPVYYPPPPGYYFGSALATGLAFGAGVAIIDSLWGDCDWDNDDIDLDVEHYNNINSNRQINANQNNWQHNSINRDGVPYRDSANREQYSRRLEGSAQRDAYRGRDTARVAERERARQSLEQRGIDSPAISNQQARERAQSATRELDRDPQARERAQAGARDISRDPARERAQAATRDAQTRERAQASTRDAQARQRAQSNPQARQQVRQQSSRARGSRDNAFAGARSPSQSRAQVSRGQTSRATASRPQTARASGQTVQRASRAPSRSGGGRRR